MFHFDLLSSSVTSVWSALGWSVIHFLWQGVLIGLFTAVLLDALPRHKSSSRYLVASGAMLVSFLCFVGTFLWLLPTAAATTSTSAWELQPTLFIPLASSTTLDVSAIAAWCWSFGVLFMSIRFARQWMWTRRLKTTSVSRPTPEWEDLFLSLKRELGIKKAVRFLQSTLVETPMLVGWIAPVVLVPVSTFTALTPDQLRLILSHELAHIRRHDHILNLVQCIIESILFFHPITWWISKEIRLEREYCCDDVSILSKSDRRHLAEALTRLESFQLATPNTLLAANGGSLMNRISRILETNTNKSATRLGNRSFFSGAIAMLLVAVGLTTLGAGCVNNSANETITREEYGRMATEMREAVASGWLTEEEMTSKLGELRMQIAPRANDDRRASREAIRTRLGAIEERVASGEMSREEADENIAKVRRRIAAGRAEQTEEPRTFTRGEYLRAKKKMDGMVKAGEASQEDVDTRLGQMRRMIASDQSERGGEAKTFTRAEYAAAKEKIDGMVAAGEVSQEDADTRLGQMRRMISRDRSAGDGEARTFTRSEYAAAKEKIDGMVAAGEVSREDGDARLGQMRRMIVRADAAPQREEREEFDWESTRERIEAAVEAGEVTREQADARYEGIKKRLELGEKKREESKGAELDWTGVKERIEGAVEAGELTREEADARYKGIEARLKAGGDQAARTTARMEYADAEAKIKAKVEAGEVSAEAAEKRLHKMREAFEKKDER